MDHISRIKEDRRVITRQYYNMGATIYINIYLHVTWLLFEKFVSTTFTYTYL